MKIGLYMEREMLVFVTEMYSKLVIEGHDIITDLECLCKKEKIEGLDGIIVHPHYNNKEGCWDRIKKIIEGSKGSLFFLMAIGTSEREDFFGQKPNLIYVDHRNQKDFFGDANYIKKCLNDFRR